MTFALIAEVYKPKERLKEGDQYKSNQKLEDKSLTKFSCVKKAKIG